MTEALTLACQREVYEKNVQGFNGVYTGEEAGFSRYPCSLCRSQLGGQRWLAIGLKDNPHTGRGQIAETLGHCCQDCFDRINK